MKDNRWTCDNDGDFSLELGQILTVGVGIIHSISLGYSGGAPLYYKAFVCNIQDYAYGASNRLYADQEFELSADGLLAAKKRAVEFARELLTEALVSLDGVVGDE